jgi:hypothetical protein
MLTDDKVMFAEALAYGGTPNVIDLGATAKAIGQPIKCFIVGHSLAGVTAIVVNDGTTSSPATTRMTIVVSAATLNAGVFEFYLPANTQRYITLAAPTGGSGGTYTAGIVLGSQTAK